MANQGILEQPAAYASKQDARSALSRQKLLEAVVRIIQTRGISGLNVRAICKEAGLSTGAFYHLFDSKEDVIGYYLIYTFKRYEAEMIASNENLTASQKVRNIYQYMVKCYEEAGWEFMTAFYTPANPMLNYKSRSESNSVVLEKACEYLAEGQEEGTIRSDLDFDGVKLEIAMIATGVMFYWCVFHGDMDAAGVIDRKLEQYLSTLEAPRAADGRIARAGASGGSGAAQ